jgi:hypothetical protein
MVIYFIVRIFHVLMLVGSFKSTLPEIFIFNILRILLLVKYYIFLFINFFIKIYFK